jgi:uncharacterized protein (DUF2461 family)
MKIVLDFLNQLAENNNKEWFDANKSFYKEVKQTFEAFTEKLIINISIEKIPISLELSFLQLQKSLFRQIPYGCIIQWIANHYDSVIFIE